MLILTRLMLLALVAFVNPAMAACGVSLNDDLLTLQKCVWSQGVAIEDQEMRIRTMSQHIDSLLKILEAQRRSIDILDSRVNDLQLEVVRLGGWKTKPAKK